MAEGRDWTRTQFEACPDCGADPSSVADTDLGDEVVRDIARWGRLLATAEPARLRRRPAPEVWSALEYACHVRDLLPVMTGRITRMATEDDPELGWWDHEAAVTERDYAAQDAVLTVEAMTTNGRAFAAELNRVTAADPSVWDRRAVRRAGEEFTIRGIARFVLHEVVHHRVDAARSLAVEDSP